MTHTMGWPLGGNAGGGSFMYHLENNQVYLGFVVHLNYKNPHVFPYMEFQRFKHHPMIKQGAGGRQARRLWRPRDLGGRLAVHPEAGLPGRRADLGCSAGLVNVPRIKGNHNAMLSGIHAAEAAWEARAGRTAAAMSWRPMPKRCAAGPIAEGSEARAQRQAALVQDRALGRGLRWAVWICGWPTSPAGRPSAP